MSLNDTTALPVLAAVLTGVVTPLIIYLFSRRAQLRQLNTTSDATLVISLQAQIHVLDAKIEKADLRLVTEQAEWTEQLKIAHMENSRLALAVAKCQTDLDITNQRVVELLRSKSTE